MPRVIANVSLSSIFDQVMDRDRIIILSLRSQADFALNLPIFTVKRFLFPTINLVCTLLLHVTSHILFIDLAMLRCFELVSSVVISVIVCLDSTRSGVLVLAHQVKLFL